MRQYTREHALWLFIALCAGVLRFLALNLPLSDSEARFALESLNAARGQTAVLVNPLSGALQSFALALFGDSSTVARAIGAAAGTLMCLLPALLRRTIGRERALALAVLLTISPTLMFISRQASGEALAWMLALLVAFAGARTGLLAAGLGLLLACGIDALFPLVTALSARYLLADSPFIPAERKRFALQTIVCFVAGATGMLLRPAGLSDVFGGFAAWVSGFITPSGFSLGRILLGIAVNELLIIVFAVIGIALAFVKRQFRFERNSLAWLILGLIVLLVYAGRGPGHAVPLVIGAAILASGALAPLLAAVLQPTRWTQWAVAAVGFVMMQFVGIGLRQYAHQGRDNFLLPIAVAMLMCGAMVLAAHLNGELLPGLRGVGTALVATLGLYALGSGVQLTQVRWDNPAEPYVLNAPSEQLTALANTIRLSAVRATGEPDGVPMVLDPTAPPSLRWALRDQSRLQLGKDLGALSAGVLPAAVKPVTERGFIGNGFEVARSGDLTHSCGASTDSTECVTFAKWLIFRELRSDKITSQRWTLWLSEKLAAQTSGQR